MSRRARPAGSRAPLGLRAAAGRVAVIAATLAAVSITLASAGEAKSKCFPREGNCVAVEVNGQAAVSLGKRERRQQLEAYAGTLYVDDVSSWIPQPIRGELEIEADIVPGSAEWFGEGPQVSAAVVPLEDVALDASRSLGAEPSVRIGGKPVLTERLELESNHLPPGAYLLRVTVRGASNWDRATVFVRVAAEP